MTGRKYWTTTAITKYAPELGITKRDVEHHMNNGELPYTQRNTGVRVVERDNALIYIGKWWLRAHGLPGWISREQFEKQHGTTLFHSVPQKDYYQIPRFDVFDSRFFWEQDAWDAVHQRGRFAPKTITVKRVSVKEVIEMREPRGNECLRAGCDRPGRRQPEGWGFRFCDEHLPAWWAVRDRPRGTASVPQSQQRNPHQLTLGVA